MAAGLRRNGEGRMTEDAAEGAERERPAPAPAAARQHPAPATSRGATGLRTVALATVFAAASGYVILVIAARTLGAASYDIFAVFWAAFFALGGVVNGLMHETTRAVSSLEEQVRPGRGTLPLRAAALVAVVAAALLCVTGPLWGPRVIPDHTVTGVLLLAAGIASFTVQGVVSGALSGTGLWSWYAVLLTVDAALRLLVASAATAASRPAVGFMLATVAGAATWLVLVGVVPVARQVLRVRVEETPARFLRRAGQAMLAASATAVLVVGFPVLLKATARDTPPEVLGGLILAVTLTRAPLLVPLTAFQNAIVVYFVHRRSQGFRVLARPVLGMLAVGAAGAGAAWVAGPPIIALMGEDFDVSGLTLAALTGGAAVTAALFVSGSAALAFALHRAYLTGWWVATGIAVVVLLAPAPLTARTIIALLAGPLAGLTWHAITIAVAARRVGVAAAGGREGRPGERDSPRPA